jgi:hypothetical protein
MFRISTVTITGWSKRYAAAELCKESANPPVAGPTGVVAERICTERRYTKSIAIYSYRAEQSHERGSC